MREGSGLSTKVSYEKPLKVVRIEGKKEKNTIELDLKDFVGGKAKPFFLQDGDSVWIPSIDEVAANEINIYVSGEVKKPGAYPFMPGYTAKIYIGIAGGLTERARYSQTEIIKADGKKIPFREDTVLELGDTINVPERFMKVWQDCLTVATSISSLTLAVVAALK